MILSMLPLPFLFCSLSLIQATISINKRKRPITRSMTRRILRNQNESNHFHLSLKDTNIRRKRLKRNLVPDSSLNEFNKDSINSIQRVLSNKMIAYDSNRIMIIDKFFFNIFKLKLSDITEMIAEYDYDESLKCVYEKVIKGLEISKEMLSILNFYSKTFVRDLIPLMEKTLFPNYDIFWYNSLKLIFKWMLYRREKTADNDNRDNEKEFQDSLTDIQSINFIIWEKSHINLSIHLNFKSMSIDNLGKLKSLFKCELLENSHIFNSFASAIKDFIDNFNVNKNEIMACRELRIKYFNGHFDKNVRLKYLILQHGPIKEMKNCILKRGFINHSNHSKSHLLFIENVTEEYLENLKFKGLKELEINFFHDGNYLSKPLFEFLRATNQKIKMTKSFDLFDLLRKLNIENLLNWDMIKNLVGFLLVDGSFGWNQEEFNVFIENFKGNIRYRDQLSEFNEYLKKLDSQSL